MKDLFGSDMGFLLRGSQNICRAVLNFFLGSDNPGGCGGGGWAHSFDVELSPEVMFEYCSVPLLKASQMG
jgi:hypothetical protein